MADLSDRTAVIFGGTGTVGEGIVRAFLGAGATVAVPSRKQESVDNLITRVGETANGRLLGIVGEAGDADGVHAIRDEVVDRLGEPHAVVASINGPASMDTPVSEITPEQWHNCLANNLTPHFLVARAFIPLLAGRVGTSYTAISGGLVQQPMTGTGTAVVPGAGVVMLMRLLFEEYKNDPLRPNVVSINSIVASGDGDSMHPERVTAADVGRFCAWLGSNEASMVTNGIHDLNQHLKNTPETR